MRPHETLSRRVFACVACGLFVVALLVAFGLRRHAAHRLPESRAAPWVRPKKTEWRSVAAEKAAVAPRPDFVAETLLEKVVPTAQQDPEGAFAWLEGTNYFAEPARCDDEVLRRVLLPLAEREPSRAFMALVRHRELADRAPWQLAAQTALRVSVERGASLASALEWANRELADLPVWESTLVELAGTSLRRDPQQPLAALQAIAGPELNVQLALQR